MQQFARALTAVGEALNEPVSADRIRVYWTVLQHYGEDAAVRACAESLRRSKWFPKPAELIDIIEAGPRDRVEIESDAAHAFGQIQAVMSDRAAVNALAAGDSRTAAGLAALGGYGGLVHSNDAASYLALRFTRAYVGAEQAQHRQLKAEQIESADIAGLLGEIGRMPQ